MSKALCPTDNLFVKNATLQLKDINFEDVSFDNSKWLGLHRLSVRRLLPNKN